MTVSVTLAPAATAVGIPVMAPGDGFKDNPAGSVPLLSNHEYGAVPPLAAMVELYAVPTWPLGRDVVRISSGIGTMVRTSVIIFADGGFSESLTLKVNWEEFAAVGIPATVPVDAFKDNPDGSVPLVRAHE